MGKKGGDGGNQAAMARADEQERQNRIRQGTTRINEIFDGRPAGTNRITAGAVFDPTKTYFLADGNPWAPKPVTATGGTGGVAKMFNSFDPNATPGASAEGGGTQPMQTSFGPPAEENTLDPAAQFAQMVARGEIYGGAEKTTGFNDDFYRGRRDAFVNYATPQLDDQYADAQRELTFALARGGNLNSSVRGDKAADLQKKYDLNRQQIGDQAVSYETEARNSVEKARADLIAMLNATGDVEGAANSAMARAAALSQPQAFSPLTNLFADFTAGLGQQAAIERANAMSTAYGGPTYGRYNTGLFGNSKAVKVM